MNRYQIPTDTSNSVRNKSEKKTANQHDDDDDVDSVFIPSPDLPYLIHLSSLTEHELNEIKGDDGE